MYIESMEYWILGAIIVFLAIAWINASTIEGFEDSVNYPDIYKNQMATLAT
jgi:hypothetical protein